MAKVKILDTTGVTNLWSNIKTYVSNAVKNFVTSSSLTETLKSYETTSALTETLKSYATTTALSGKADSSHTHVIKDITDLDLSTYYTKDEIDTKFTANVSYAYSATLPEVASASVGVIYIVPNADKESGNLCDEYMLVNGAFEKIGSTKTDLSSYYTKSEVNTALGKKADSSHKHVIADITDFPSLEDLGGILDVKVDGTSVVSNGVAEITLPTATSLGAVTSIKVDGTEVVSDGAASITLPTLSSLGAQAAITGGASTITTTNLTASKALVSNASGKVAASSVTATELGYVSGVTSAIQTQIDAKADASSLSDYLTTADAATTYQPAGNYVTTDDFEAITKEELDAICV